MSEPIITLGVHGGNVIASIVYGAEPLTYLETRADSGKCPVMMDVQELGQLIDRLEYLRGLMA